MAAVTAAVVATAATAAAAASQAGAFSGGSSGGGGSTDTNYKKVPQDPQDKAMRDYYARALVANSGKTYPGFGEYLQSGGDPAKAEFPLEMPGMKPSEAAALGFTGSRGEAIPTTSPEAIAEQGGALTQEQQMYLAEERRRQAAAEGHAPGPWAAKIGKVSNRLERVSGKLEKLGAVEDPTRRQEKKIERLTGKQTKLTQRQQDLLGG